jgi:hypothetical protein
MTADGSNRPDWQSDPDWQSVDHIELTVPDSRTDPGRPSRPSRPIRQRWCLAAVGLAAVGVLAGGLLYADRTRTVISTRVVSSPGQATADLTGCPVTANCTWRDQPDGGPLFVAVKRLLPTAALIRAESVFDTGSAREYLARLAVRTSDGLLLTLTATRNVTDRAVLGWQSPLPAGGPADIALVVPGHQPGSAVAVTATVPAGVAVPAAALRELAADPSLQLAP